MVRSVRAGVLVVASFVLGCGGALNQPGFDGGLGGQGGSAVDSGPDLPVDLIVDASLDLPVDAATDANGDAPDCDCRVEGFTLTMSWACFCAKFGCTDREPACASNRATYPGCGLTTDTFNT